MNQQVEEKMNAPTDRPAPLKSEYSVSELIEFGRRIGALYGEKAEATFVVQTDPTNSRAAILVTPRKFVAQRYVYAASWIELLEAAEKDAVAYVQSNREMVAADLGEF